MMETIRSWTPSKHSPVGIPAGDERRRREPGIGQGAHRARYIRLLFGLCAVAIHVSATSDLAAQQGEDNVAPLARCEALLRAALADSTQVRLLLPFHQEQQRTVIIDGRLASAEQIKALEELSPPLLAHRVEATIQVVGEAAKRMEQEAGRSLGGRVVCIIMRKPAVQAGAWQR
jgi:hypothetical protein